MGKSLALLRNLWFREQSLGNGALGKQNRPQLRRDDPVLCPQFDDENQESVVVGV